MSTFAADTWGVPGPAFAALYPVLIVGVLLLVVSLRKGSRRTTAVPGPPLTAIEIAYLREGKQLAVATALGTLRAEGVLDDAARPVGTAQRHDPLERAVLHALGLTGGRKESRRVTSLVENLGVRSALLVLTSRLSARGLVRTRAQTARALSWSLLAWAVAALGLARMVAGSNAGKPIGFVTLEFMVAVFVAIGLSVTVTLGPTRPAAALIDDAARVNGHLDPKLRPSWTTYGAAGAGMSVALFGTSALVFAAPAFASNVAATPSSSDGGSSSSGDSGGGGCGGGCGG